MNKKIDRKISMICAWALAMALLAPSALAAEVKTNPSDYAKVVAQENGISVETAISNIKGTISKLKINIQQGMVSKSRLETLAQQLYDLEKAVKNTNQAPSASVISVLNDAEKVVQGVEGNETVLTAVATVRESLGITTLEDTTTVQSPMASNIKGFSDVPKTHWGYNAIMDMVGRGLLNGTTSPDANGIATFDANSAMTKSAYITVAVRVAYQDELNSMPAGKDWWSNAYDLALKYGIITADDPYMDRENMDDAIKREEMALILVRTAHAKGVATESLVYPAQISDYNNISPYYRDAVRECYTLGILNGTGNGFEPQVSLNRVSACQSFYNLLVPEVRKPITPQQPTETEDNRRTHGGYVSDTGLTKGMIIADYSRQFECNALSQARFGVDEQGVYVNLAAPKLPDELPEYEYTFNITAYDNNGDYANAPYTRRYTLKQGETKKVYLVDYGVEGMGGDNIKSVNGLSEITLSVEIISENNDDGGMFIRKISSTNKSTAYATWYDGEPDPVALDHSAVWEGLGW